MEKIEVNVGSRQILKSLANKLGGELWDKTPDSEHSHRFIRIYVPEIFYWYFSITPTKGVVNIEFKAAYLNRATVKAVVKAIARIQEELVIMQGKLNQLKPQYNEQEST